MCVWVRLCLCVCVWNKTKKCYPSICQSVCLLVFCNKTLQKRPISNRRWSVDLRPTTGGWHVAYPLFFFSAREPSSNQNRNRSHSLFFKCIYVTQNFEKKNALIYICSHFTYIKFITFIYVTQNVERKKNKTMSRTFFLFSKSLTIFKCIYFTQNF